MRRILMQRTTAMIVPLIGLSMFLFRTSTKADNHRSDDRQKADSIILTYLGTAGWEITVGKIVILLDPYTQG